MPLRLLASLLCPLLLLLASCGNPPAPIRISINAWPGYEFLYLAQEKGLFEAEGVQVQLVEFGSLSDVRRAFEKGQIDGMAATLVEVLQARDISPRTPQVVLAVDYSNGADVILAQKSISSVAELKGTRVGLELASLNVFLLGRALEKNGLTVKDLKLVGSDQNSLEEMFNKGQLDAVVSYPPNSVRLKNHANTLFSSADIPGEVFDVLAMDAKLIQQRPEDVARIIRAFHAAIAYAEAHPDEAYQLMGQREGITGQEFGSILQHDITMLHLNDQPEYFGPQGKLKQAALQMEQVLRDTGQISGPSRQEPIDNTIPLDMLKL